MMIKKCLLLMLLGVLAVGNSHSQIHEGKVFVGSSSTLSFSSVKNYAEYDGVKGDETKSSTFSLTPTIGYFFDDNLAFTLSLSIDNSNQKSEDDEKYTSSNVMFGPGLKYFFGGGNVKPYLQGDLMFGNYMQRYEDGSYDEKFGAKSFAYDLGFGVACFVNDYVAFDFGLGYAKLTLTDEDDKKAKSITSGLALQGGIMVVF